MKKKKVILTGKEHAKINKRKKFYEKFERTCQKLSNESDSDQVVLLTMNKGYSFPEYDELSKILQSDYYKLESEINIEELSSLEITFYEEAHFLLKASKSKILVIFRRETFVDNEGNERKGQSGADDRFNYQTAYNWGIQIKDVKKLLTLIEKEKEEPSEYNLKPEMAEIEQPTYRKAWKPPRRRRR